MYNGIINVYKEADFTSFDVVAKLRGILKQKKIGHTGTLDPQATGVLPVCLGNGTKLCDMLTDRSKEYKAVMLLGVSTDTEDTSGTVLLSRDVNVTEDKVREAVMSFVGAYEQIPPMYSAIKVDGKKLYELAREGKVIERKARHVEIDSIEITEISLPYVTMIINCSKGTYIRSLCRDIGEKLGTLGCMDSLVRTRVGNFKLENAMKLSKIEELVQMGEISNFIDSVEDTLYEYPIINVLPEYKKKIDNGNPLEISSFSEQISPKNGDKYRVRNAEGIFFAVYYFDSNKNVLMPDKIFPID